MDDHYRRAYHSAIHELEMADRWRWVDLVISFASGACLSWILTSLLGGSGG